MLYFERRRPPLEIWFARTRPEFEAVSLETGEHTDSLEILQREGAFIVFVNLPKAIDDIARDLALFGTLTIYGAGRAAAHYHVGKRGVSMAGLQAYKLNEAWNLDEVRQFWFALDEICARVGVLPQSTPGATAFSIANALSPNGFISPGPHIREWARYAFSAGARHARPGVYEEASLYDIHSAYPFSMHEPLPFGKWIRTRKDYPFYISKVILDYQAYEDFSPLWVRGQDGLVYHPVEAHDLPAVLNSIDLQTLDQHGRLRIKKEIDRIGFEVKPILAPAQEYLEECQRKFHDYRPQIKILRNSIYGKFAQSPGHETYVLKAIERKALGKAMASGALYNVLEATPDPDIVLALFRRIDDTESFNHPPVASAITALTRKKVYEAIDKNTVAVHTDSILSKTTREEIGLGPNDGQWDLQGKGRAIVYGRAGFIIEREHHLDGVQYIKPTPDGFMATASSHKIWSFAPDDYTTAEWDLLIERPETAKFEEGMIQIYHSPRGVPVGLKIPPDYNEI